MERHHGNGDEVDFAQPVSSLSPGSNPANDICESNGRKASRHRVFKFELGGEDMFNLLELLRKLAVESPVYQTVARAVTYERLLYEQAREQGF